MRQLFVFTAGDAAARKHLSDSVTAPAPIALLDECLDPDQAAFLRPLLDDAQGFFAWGAVPGPRNVPMWNAMQVGDVVLTVFDNRYRFASSVIGKVHSADLAKRIWGVDDEGKTWEYVYLLTPPRPVDVAVTAEPVISYLNNGYRGFTRISDSRVEKIIEDYSTTDAFIQAVFSTSLPPTPVQRDVKAAEVGLSPSSFDPQNLSDARQKVIAEIVRRRGQPKFRSELLKAYGMRCAVTGCEVISVLEAAHIISYLGSDTNHVTNGILLRADIHTLYDLGDLRIDSSGIVHLDDSLMQSIYAQYAGSKARLPADTAKAPNPGALAVKFGNLASPLATKLAP